MNLLTRWTRRGNAQAAYFKADKRAGKVIAELEHVTDPTVRARLLVELASLEYRMGEQNAAGWKDSKDDEGFTLTESCYHAGRLVELIASTETAGAPAGRDTESVWEDALGPVLDELTTVSAPAVRAELMNRLYLAAHPLVGSQAAEAIETLRRTYLRIALNYPTGATTKH